MEIKIAVAVSDNGETRTCGPNDYIAEDHSCAMSAAVTWLLEAGEIANATYWVEAVLPDPVQTVKGEAREASKTSAT